MGGLKRRETTVGPVAFGGRTITLVARTTALHIGGDDRGASSVRARPAHVEVLDEHGQHQLVQIRDVEQILIAAIAVAAIAGARAMRFIRTSQKERTSA